MEPTFKTGDVVRQLGINRDAISRWMRHFKDFMSPQEGRNYRITNDDFVVLATIKELSDKNLRLDDIYTKLSDGYRVKELDAYVLPIDMIPLKQAVDATNIKAELEILTNERDRLLDMVQDLQANLDMQTAKMEELQNKLDTVRDDMYEKNKEEREKILTLTERAARAEAQVEMLREILKDK